MHCIRSIPACLLIICLSGCSSNPATGRNQLILVSAQEVTAMGISAQPQLIEEYGGESSSPELREFVRRVGFRVLEQIEPEYEELPWEFFLLESDVINAFALPGGKVFITVGLLSKLSNEAQVAGVLGHEIGHVSARHVDERISQSMIIELGLSALGSYSESQLATVGAQLFGKGYLLSFNRDQELEADAQGLKYMSRVHYDPSGLMGVLLVLQEASKDNRNLEILATHPHPETRMDQVTKLLAGRYRSTQNNPEYHKYEDRFLTRVVPFLPTSVAGVMGVNPGSSFCGVCDDRFSAAHGGKISGP